MAHVRTVRCEVSVVGSKNSSVVDGYTVWLTTSSLTQSYVKVPAGFWLGTIDCNDLIHHCCLGGVHLSYLWSQNFHQLLVLL